MSSVRPDAPPRDTQEAVFRFLADPNTHGLSEPVERVDTANAVVFLAGADAYKLKRAVKFPFMDLSTLDKRREACEAEIAVNRPLAPQIYLSALPITRRGETFALGGDGEIVEWAVHMRRFDETPRSITSPIKRARSTRSSTNWRSRSAARTLAPRSGMQRAPRMRSKLTSSRTARLSPSCPISSTRRRRASSPTIRGSHLRLCARSCSSAARPVSFAAVTAICTCATLFSSTASRRCSTRWNFRTKLRAGTFFTTWLFF